MHLVEVEVCTQLEQFGEPNYQWGVGQFLLIPPILQDVALRWHGPMYPFLFEGCSTIVAPSVLIANANLTID
jgi:hypothetical protein